MSSFDDADTRFFKGQVGAHVQASDVYLIPVGRNNWASVDGKDADWLSEYRWHLQTNRTTDIVYAVREIRLSDGIRKIIRMHREILGLEHGDGILVDHIDRNGLNNCRRNLRIANKRINTLNSKRRIDNSSGFTGVSRARGGRWRAYTTDNGIQIFLGVYQTIEEAIYARAKYDRSSA